MKQIILPEIVTVGIYNGSLVTKARETRKRTTTMFELELPTEDGGISYINNESTAIRNDVIICAKPGQVRHTRLPFKCYFIHLTVSEGELYDRLISLPSYLKIDGRPRYEELFKQLKAGYDKQLEGEQLLIQGRVLELIYLLCGSAERQSFTERGNNKVAIDKAIRYVKDNLSADLSLSAISALVGFSHVHFHNCFKKATGLTLRDFVTEQRLRKAVNLLVGADLTLTQIAYECGFSSQAYFSYVFKKKMNMTPREYVRSVYERYEK